jgi:hypothetical protein
VSGNLGVVNSYNTLSTSGTDNVGGLVGANIGGTITTSHVSAPTTSVLRLNGNGYPDSETASAGGLVGLNSGIVAKSYVSGNGVNSATFISSDGFAQAAQQTVNVGGLIGQNTSSGTVMNSYATTAVGNSGTTDNGFGCAGGCNVSANVGGLIGNNTGSATSNYSSGAVNSNVQSNSSGSTIQNHVAGSAPLSPVPNPSWSGYQALETGTNFTSVTGTWSVPAVSLPFVNPPAIVANSSTWVGGRLI